MSAVPHARPPHLTRREQHQMAEEHLEAALVILDLAGCPRPALHAQHALDLLRLELCG